MGCIQSREAPSALAVGGHPDVLSRKDSSGTVAPDAGGRYASSLSAQLATIPEAKTSEHVLPGLSSTLPACAAVANESLACMSPLTAVAAELPNNASLPQPRSTTPPRSAGGDAKPALRSPPTSLPAATTTVEMPTPPATLPLVTPRSGRDVVEVSSARKVKDASTGQKRINQYLILEVLGKGAYGKVRRCVDETTGEVRAVKIMKKSFLKRKRIGRFGNALQNVQREIAVWKKLDHPNVVVLFEVS
jgi:hypothetical protein